MSAVILAALSAAACACLIDRRTRREMVRFLWPLHLGWIYMRHLTPVEKIALVALGDAALVGLVGWGVFRPWLPDPVGVAAVVLGGLALIVIILRRALRSPDGPP